MRAEKSQTQAVHLLARIYLDRGDYKEAVNFSAESARRNRGAGHPEDYVIAVRALTQLGDYEKARKSAELLAELPGQQAAATFEFAKIEAAQNGRQAAIGSIAKSGLDLTDPASGRVLGLLAEYLDSLSRNEEALSSVDAALARHPDEAQFHVLRGTVLTRSQRLDAAKQEFETARKLDPESGAAFAGLAVLAGNAGDLEEAVKLFDVASRYNELNTPDYDYSAAQLTLKLGDRKAAIERLRKITRKYLGHAGSRNDLAWLLAEDGVELDLALALAEEARRLDPSPDILDTLGTVHMKRGEAAAAVAVLEDAYEQQPDSPYLRLHLGTALALAGDTNRAKELLQSVLRTEGFPEAEAARRELAKLEP
jgi:tetratricopeptide (TPR) repeat protein